MACLCRPIADMSERRLLGYSHGVPIRGADTRQGAHESVGSDPQHCTTWALFRPDTVVRLKEIGHPLALIHSVRA